MASELSQLKPIRISFQTREDAVRGFYVLLTSGMPVHTTADEKYVVNAVQCNLLSQKGIEYIKEK